MAPRPWTWLAVAALAFGAQTGCVDEDKRGCKVDGDCRGLRVCRDAVCVTPEGFSDEDLRDDLGIPDPDDDEDGEVSGRACGGGSLTFSATLEGGGVQALSQGVDAVLIGIDQRVGALVLELTDEADRALVVSLALDLPGTPNATPALESGARYQVRYVEVDAPFAFGQLLEVTRDGALVLAACSGDGVQVPCRGASWLIERAEGEVCPEEDTGCGLGRRVALRTASDAGEVELAPGQSASFDLGDGQQLRHLVMEAVEVPTPCPDGPTFVQEVAFLRVTP